MVYERMQEFEAAGREQTNVGEARKVARLVYRQKNERHRGERKLGQELELRCAFHQGSNEEG
jgi:hypothetical protein